MLGICCLLLLKRSDRCYVDYVVRAWSKGKVVALNSYHMKLDPHNHNAKSSATVAAP